MASRDAGQAVAQPGGARTRILETAYELFSREGIRAVGIDRIIAEAGIAKATLYRHFASKQDLVVAFLGLRGRRWTHEWLAAEAERLAAQPRERVLSVFDALDEWFHRKDYEGCAFIKTLLEMSDAEDPIHREAARQLNVIGELLEGYAEQAGAETPRDMASRLQMLMMGAIIAAGSGDREAARRARSFAELMLESAR